MLGKNTVARFLGGKITFRVSGSADVDEFIKDLNGVAARSTDLSPALEAIGHYLMGSINRNFERGGRPNKWAGLAPSTIKDRARHGYGPTPILVRSGLLKNSLTVPGAPKQIFRVGPRSLKFGTRVKYYPYHQYGTDTIPQRIMVTLQRQDRAQVGRIINTFIRTGETFRRRR